MLCFMSEKLWPNKVKRNVEGRSNRGRGYGVYLRQLGAQTGPAPAPIAARQQLQSRGNLVYQGQSATIAFVILSHLCACALY